jgi:hypothetical protein
MQTYFKIFIFHHFLMYAWIETGTFTVWEKGGVLNVKHGTPYNNHGALKV